MQLHDLKPSKTKKSKKRVGRGGKRGTYAGRGQNGQRANAGGRLPSPEREQIKKFPKLRGIKNKSKKPSPVIVNVGDLDKLFGDEKNITSVSFIEKGMIKRKSSPVKILGDGEVKSVYNLKNVAVSKSAKLKIEKAGGKVDSS